jgi:hypothetical protein
MPVEIEQTHFVRGIVDGTSAIVGSIACPKQNALPWRATANELAEHRLPVRQMRADHMVVAIRIFLTTALSGR